MKKCISMVIIGMLVFCGLHASALSRNMIQTSITTWGQEPPRIAACDGEVLDQHQMHNGTFGVIGVFPLSPGKNISIAQSFIPQKEMLTRIQIEIGKNATTTYPYMLAIRKDLTAENIGLSYVPAVDILTENFSWINFPFRNVKLTPGEIYWMISYTANVTDNFYAWLANGTNLYPNGSVAISLNDGQTWQNETSVDMTFMTYGMDATELTLRVTGGIGVKYTIKNIGSVNATGVEFKMTIKGGVFNLINITRAYTLAFPLLPTNQTIDWAVPLGLGFIAVTVSVRARNALEVTKNASGLILFFLVLLK